MWKENVIVQSLAGSDKIWKRFYSYKKSTDRSRMISPWIDGDMQTFLESKPRTESIWRSVILFGRNVASYKFALGKSLKD